MLIKMEVQVLLYLLMMLYCGDGGGLNCSRDIVTVSVGQERVSKISGCSSSCGNVRGL